MSKAVSGKARGAVAGLALGLASLALGGCGCRRTRTRPTSSSLSRFSTTARSMTSASRNTRPRPRASRKSTASTPTRCGRPRREIMAAFAYYQSNKYDEADHRARPLHPASSRAPRHPLRLLPEGAVLLRADLRHRPRPAHHPAGARRPGRSRQALPRIALCPRRAPQGRARHRPSRRQGDGGRPLLPAEPAVYRGDQPLSRR